jgi:hypothetical protein
MDCYRFDREYNLVECGQCDVHAAIALFEQCYQNGMRHYDSGEEAVAATSFGLSRSEADFIEISCNGQESVAVHADRLHFPSALSKAFTSKRHFRIVGSRAVGLEAIRDYFALNRPDFEGKYRDCLCR